MASATPSSISVRDPEEHAWLSRGHAPFAGKYRAERILGRGGMGVVFEAHHIRLGQRVAIKVLGSDLREFPELVQRFEREARAAGSLTSSHAVRVFDIDTIEDGTPFIVMELLAGRDLSRIVERDGPQPVARSVRWVIEACDAIAEAHRLGIIHRDLKPSNLFLAEVEDRRVVKVLDFGIAKRVSTGETSITQAVAPLGTPQYMSPEQVRCAKDVDARTDVWSLGVTLYELVTGQTPFAHESSSACIASIAADPVPDPRTLRPDLPAEFAAVLMRALEKSAADRYQSIEELVAAIAPFALDDLFEEEEMVSAVRRATSILPLANAPSNHTTLDAVQEASAGADVALEIPPPAPVSVARELAEHAALEAEPPHRESAPSRPDRTVPPAISLANGPPKRRFTSSFAMLSAAVVGLAALVFTPRCVATSGGDLAAAPALHAAFPSTNARNARGSVTDPPSAVVVAPAPSPVAAAPEATPATSAPVATPPVVTAEPSAQPLAAPRSALTAPTVPPVAAASAKRSAKLEKPVPAKDIASSPMVHGGLSNPGF